MLWFSGKRVNQFVLTEIATTNRITYNVIKCGYNFCLNVFASWKVFRK